MKGKELNLISPNDFENQVHEQFVAFALVAKKVLEKVLEEISGFERISRCLSSQGS